MAGPELDDWFEREELIGQISDIRVQNLQVEREVVQKRTFTRWMNLHLEKCNPPMEVRDLFRDIQDGKILMALLEELSGCKLLHGYKPSAHRIFRLNNIAKVLTFLEERNMKLVSIDATDIADGNSSIVLGLIWNIILFFQIKELTGNIKSQFPSSSSLSSIPTSSDSDTSHSSTPSDERKPTIVPRGHGKAIKTLLQWVQRRTRKYGVAVQDFRKSWTSGLAFLAVIKSIDPSVVDMRRALLQTPRENIEEAFRTAHYSLGIPRLLEPEDVMLNPPDEQSIMTYVSQFLEHFPGIEEDETSDILERSKASARMNEPPVRNGVQRKRESYMAKRDLVQPPPKIFISSVSQDREQITSPVQSQTPEYRPWSSEGSSMGSSPNPANDKPLHHPLDLNKDVSTTSSPQPSFSDSAVNSPDSWSEVLSETTNSHQIHEDPSESSTAGTVEVTSDLGSPFSPESIPENNLDRELFIDEGNYSLGSMDSLHAKSTATSEEDNAYKYILDLKEEQSANHLPSDNMRNKSDAGCSEQPETNPLEHQEPVKPSSDYPSCLESDSGYFHDNKEAMSAQSEDESPLTSTVDENVSGNLESESFVKSSNTEANPLELTDGPEEKPIMFEYDTEPECPVLQFERVSISGSEEDIKLCTDLTEEQSEEPGKNDLENGHFETIKDSSDLHNGEQTGILEIEVKDVMYDNLEEPISDQSQTEVEFPDEDQVCYMCGCSVAKNSAESGNQGGDCLSHLNSTERDCNSDLRHFSESEAGGNFEDNPREQNNELNGTVSDLENETRESTDIHEDLLILGKSNMESGSDDIRRTEFSHNTNGESQAQVTENIEPGGAKDNRPVSVVDSHCDVLKSVTETFVEPPSDGTNHDGENDSTSATGMHPDSPVEAETTCEDSEPITGFRGYLERRPVELRLSLSMTPLQPATPKRSLTESDTDTEDTSEDLGKGFKSRKDRVGSLHLQEQSPFDRHPGEWGAVEPDSPAEHFELIKTDEDLTSAGARENTGALRKEEVTDASQPLTAINLRRVVDTSESQVQNGKTIDGSKVDSTVINKSLESKTAVSPESTHDTTLSDLIYVLLAAWLFVYCLLVLPQIDSRMLPKLLFNIDE